jgi:hypothetical protein
VHSVGSVALFAGVEVQASIFFAIPVIHGHTVGVTVITIDAENTPGFCFQDFNAFFL